MRTWSWAFILVVTVLPPLFLDLYPLSVFPMFSDNAAEHLFVEVLNESGEQESVVNYGLFKLQLANREQRYGRKLVANYFDEHVEIDRDKVTQFLREHYPTQRYPITVRYKIRGYDLSKREITDLRPWADFTVTQADIGVAQHQQAGNIREF